MVVKSLDRKEIGFDYAFKIAKYVRKQYKS